MFQSPPGSESGTRYRCSTARPAIEPNSRFERSKFEGPSEPHPRNKVLRDPCDYGLYGIRLLVIYVIKI